MWAACLRSPCTLQRGAGLHAPADALLACLSHWLPGSFVQRWVAAAAHLTRGQTALLARGPCPRTRLSWYVLTRGALQWRHATCVWRKGERIKLCPLYSALLLGWLSSKGAAAEALQGRTGRMQQSTHRPWTVQGQEHASGNRLLLGMLLCKPEQRSRYNMICRTGCMPWTWHAYKADSA